MDRFLFLKNKGVALITVLFLMLILMLTVVWLASQLSTHIRFTSSLKKYETLFELADGACVRAIYYLKKNLPLPGNPDLSKEVEIVQNLPAYLNGTKTLLGSAYFQGKIFYRGYNTRPLPGWMLNWAGYSRFHRLYFEARGDAGSANSKAEVSALTIRITR